jgi:hypothetical protein
VELVDRPSRARWLRRWLAGRLRWMRAAGARHPFRTAWLALAAGMLIVLALFSRGAGLTLRQQLFLATATVVLAWLCTWIIFLEHDDPADTSPPAPPPAVQ